jgi:hypothetical protein
VSRIICVSCGRSTCLKIFFCDSARLRENLSCTDGSTCRANALVDQVPAEVDRDVFDLTTPEFTPEPTAESTLQQDQLNPGAPSKTMIASGDVDPRNIVSGPRHRRTTSRRCEAYMTDLAVLDNFPGFYASFSAGIMNSEQLNRIHRD